MGDEVEHLQKKINYLTNEVLLLKVLLANLPVPADVHERGWQWRPTATDTAFAPPFGTVRQCRVCGCLVAGGPTACARCAEDDFDPSKYDTVERFTKNKVRPEGEEMSDEAEHLQKKIDYLTSVVQRLEALLAILTDPNDSWLGYARVASELLECEADLKSAKTRLAELWGVK